MVTGYECVSDLILLDMVMLDVIMEMNWLTSFRAVTDCYAHHITIVVLRVPDFSSKVIGCSPIEWRP